MSQANVSRSDIEFKSCKQEQGGDMVVKKNEKPEIGDLEIESRVDSDKISTFKEQIERLTEEREERNKKMKELEALVKKLQAESILLETRSQESKLLNLTKEVAELREAKGKLEAKIKLLEDRIKKLKAEKDDIQKQLNDLSNKYAELEGDRLNLEEKVDRLEGQNKNLKEDVGDLKKENKDLKEDVGDLKKEIGVLKHELRIANRPLLVLGELSFQIASLMYQKVIPQWHNKSGSYSVQDIAKDITALADEKDEGSKILAENTWAELKKELNWKEKYVRSLKTVRYSRNFAAHPDIDEELLYNAAEEARKNDDLNNDTYNNIKELIGIWKKLKNIK